MKRLTCGALIVLLAFAAAGCSDDNFPTDPGTTPPTIITEPPFVGTITPNGAITQPFTATSFGAVVVTLIALDPNPDNTVRVGLSLGTWNGQACQMILSNDNAGTGTVITGQITSAAALCARIYDAMGSLTEPVAFEIRITHP
jgi:hypothetical protein